MFNTSVNRIKHEASKAVKNYKKRIINQDKTEIPSAMESVAEDMIASLIGDYTKPTTFSGKEEIKATIDKATGKITHIIYSPPL